MQRGIDEVATYLAEVGMEASSEKTQYMMVARPRDHRKGIAGSVRLELNGQEIGKKPHIRILGVTFEQTARSTRWIPEIEKTWAQGLKLIKKTTSKSWGADEKALRILTEALLTSRALYSCNWLNLNQTQWKKLERLNNQSRRVVTSLPKYTPLEMLEKEAQMNNIKDRAETQAIAQFQRLERTKHGRRFLQDLGYETSNKPPLEEALPPWQDEVITDHRPLPQVLNQGKRARAAKMHAAWCETHAPNEEVRYTDAAKNGDKVTSAWHDARRGRTQTELLPSGTTVREAELRAILAAAQDIAGKSATAPHARIFTDSQAAINATRSSRPKGRTIKKIKKVATELRIRGTDLHITWLPGHSEIPGNERAHRAAAEEIVHGSATGPTSHSETNNTVDPEEQAELARQARKAYLRGLLPSQEDNMPTSYTRWEAVRVRRIRTGTALTPAKQASFGLVDIEGS
ncbi:uncharacterized protein LOC120841078, partial [Ixodes scapularis]|uniref:uncharacterized protein LOC120841078 n=1 Tax=Ixodes scapularis TaxID=6945 RepID=UPI001A9CFB9E